MKYSFFGFGRGAEAFIKMWSRGVVEVDVNDIPDCSRPTDGPPMKVADLPKIEIVVDPDDDSDK